MISEIYHNLYTSIYVDLSTFERYFRIVIVENVNLMYRMLLIKMTYLKEMNDKTFMIRHIIFLFYKSRLSRP